MFADVGYGNVDVSQIVACRDDLAEVRLRMIMGVAKV